MTSSGATLISSEAQPTALIYDIQRYSLNDGAGIRSLVFFKGCPLRCPWCANPESRALAAIEVRRESRCLHCPRCAEDEDECPSGAWQRLGRRYGLDALLARLLRDELFYRVSGGGVTLSGGEVLLQAPFAAALLRRLRAQGVRTAIETSGHGRPEALLELGRLCDEVLYDFKIMDAERARRVIGIDLGRALDGFRRLSEAGVHLIPRLPLIPGHSDDLDNLRQVLDFLRPFGLGEIHLLPFHQYGASKYELIGMAYSMRDVPGLARDAIADHVRLCEDAGYRVVVGG